MEDLNIWSVIIPTVITSLIGSGGVIGIMMSGMKKSWEKRWAEKAEKAKKNEDRRIRKHQLEIDLRRAEEHMMFWLHKAIVSGEHNGDLEEAFHEYNRAEQAMKDYENQILAEVNNGG